MPRRRIRRFVGPGVFRSIVEASKATGADVPAVLYPAEADAKRAEDAEANARILQLTISTAKSDRDRDSVSADGWDFKSYRKNPVVLFSHTYWSEQAPVVGTSLAEWVERDKVKSRMEFTPEGMVPLADTLWRLYTTRSSSGKPFMRAVSVGFIPTKYEFVDTPGREGGVDFQKQELLEYSLVPVPANADALSDVKGYGAELEEARAAGIDCAPLKTWAETLLDGWVKHEDALWMKREWVEALREYVDEKHAVSVVLPKSPAAIAKQGTEIQSMLFAKEESPDDVNGGDGWTAETAKSWLDDHDFRSDKLDEGSEDAAFLRFRQFDPEACAPDSMITLSDGFPPGVQATACEVEDSDSADATAPAGPTKLPAGLKALVSLGGLVLVETAPAAGHTHVLAVKVRENGELLTGLYTTLVAEGGGFGPHAHAFSLEAQVPGDQPWAGVSGLGSDGSPAHAAAIEARAPVTVPTSGVPATRSPAPAESEAESFTLDQLAAMLQSEAEPDSFELGDDVDLKALLRETVAEEIGERLSATSGR
jgi:hypothetical protein